MNLKKINTWDIDGGLPVLIITAKSGDPLEPSRWVRLLHQGGGHACSSFERDCIILPIKESMYKKVQQLADKWLDSEVGFWGGPCLTDAVDYNKDLELLGLTCNVTYKEMMEAVYPFDLMRGALQILTDAELPEDLDDLLSFDSDFNKMLGSICRWEAFILGENCD